MSSATAFSGSSLPLYKRGRTLAETIEAYSMPVTECGCWIWMGAQLSRGYGSLNAAGFRGKAHRAAYKAFVADIPDGMHVLHKCDTPACVNPDHLFVGTHSDNMQDKHAKGRANTPTGTRNALSQFHCLVKSGERKAPVAPDRRGEKNTNAKLTEFDVLHIRNSNEKSTTLAKRYSVDRHTIIAIKKRKLWSYL